MRGIILLAVLLLAAPYAAADPAVQTQSWPQFQIIMWQGHTALQDAALKTIGVDAGLVHADRANPGSIPRFEAVPLLQNDMPWYVENIATDFYSAYHRWFPDRPVNWRFTAAQDLYRKNPRDPSALMRVPSLSNPVWLDLIRRRIGATVAANKPYRPLYYNLADESGIADLAAYWDFDFAPESLAGMRLWLKERYGTLAALNREWGSDFASWDAVMPSTTAQAMRRTDGNFASWADFKEWMDVAFARALASGRDAVHAADPHALAGIEGGQVPGWGGYDYSRLVQSVDVMELYDGGDNVDIVRSLDPGMILLTTSSAGGDAEEWRVWHEWLRGTRGLILWDENNGFVARDGSLGPRGREAAPYFHELRGALGALLINSVPRTDPVAVLYSPASMRVQWMLDWQPKGDAWIDRGSEAEGGAGNTVRAAMSAWVEACRRLGLEPGFVTSASIDEGALALYRVLVLPHDVALSSADAEAIRRFVAAGGTAIADTMPGVFDEHGKKRTVSPLADLFAPGAAHGKGMAMIADQSALATAIRTESVAPAAAVTEPDGAPAQDVDLYAFGDGDVEILGLQQSEPPPASASPPARAIAVTLRKTRFVRDLRTGKDWGPVDRLTLSLDPVKPTILALSDKPLPSPTVSVPAQLHPGEIAEIGLGLAGPTGAASDVFHLEVLNPSGAPVPSDSGMVVAPHGVGTARLPLAVGDPVGEWMLRVTDMPSGKTATAPMNVTPRE